LIAHLLVLKSGTLLQNQQQVLILLLIEAARVLDYAPPASIGCKSV
jgi:hypothetical protein